MQLAQQLTAVLERRLPQMRYLPKALRVIWEPASGWTTAWLVLVVVAGLIPAVSVTLTKHLVDDIVIATRAGGRWEAVQPVLWMAGLLAAAWVAIDLLQGILEWVRATESELIHDHLTTLIQKKALEVDIAFYEAPEYYDRLYRARDDAQGKMTLLIEHLGAVIQNVVTLVAMTGIIAAYNGFLVAAMFASVLPAFYVVARFNWMAHQWWASTVVERRWLQYLDEKFTGAPAAAEMRLFQLGGRFQAVYKELRRVLRESHLALIRRQNKARLAAASAGVVVAGSAVAWVGRLTLLGKASFGDMALFYQAFLGGQGFMRVVTLSLAQVYSKSLFLKDLFDFLALEPAIKDPAVPVPAPESVRSGIEFHGVSFRYPGSEREALRSLNLAVPAGKITAVVGPNGAGKSTLIKLVSRFYDPTGGDITIDGIRLPEFNVEDLRSMLTILFQRPVNYDASVRENISIGVLNGMPPLAEVEEAAVRAGADEMIRRLPSGYETKLGKAFDDGTDLSAGEWQRVAMARAFLRRSPIILLDEPTSFMDPWAEVEWFGRLRDLAAGRTAMVVTHRFTIAMRADLIHVMDRGQVVESGTHDSLIRRDGLYATSWREQMEACSTGTLGIEDAVTAEAPR
jgi:ATP-binding cassette, subfamily B, bacterial